MGAVSIDHSPKGAQKFQLAINYTLHFIVALFPYLVAIYLYPQESSVVTSVSMVNVNGSSLVMWALQEEFISLLADS